MIERRPGEITTLETRAAANEEVDRNLRYRQIIDVLGRVYPDGLTAKEIAVKMKMRGDIPTSERNFTAPRLTELGKRGGEGQRVKIGLIDVDGHNFPNLPLMKLSAWHKAKGDSVGWYEPFSGLIEEYDKVYMSKVFSFTPDYSEPIYAKEIEKGGTGYCIEIENGKEVFKAEKNKNLPDEIEHIYPDYSIYPDLTRDTAYGFLTRGCPRGCGFCHVAPKEGQCSRKVADLSEFWRGQRKIILCDPNILACKDHLELLQQLVESGARVNFNQGLDIRLINDQNTELLKKIKLDMIHFAFDRWQDREKIEPRLRSFAQRTGYNKDRGRVMVYILMNFDTTLEQDFYRIQLCRELKFAPYPMIYDKEHAAPIYRKIQRWCNPRIFWSVPTFADYQGK